MFDIKARLDSALVTGAAAIAAGALAALGIVWLSVALAAALGEVLPEPAALAAVGLLCIAPLAILLIMRGRKPGHPGTNAAAVDPLEPTISFDRLSQSIDAIAKNSPVGAVGVAFGAAWIASRSPNAGAISAALSQQAIERLVQLVAELSQPAAPQEDAEKPPA